MSMTNYWVGVDESIHQDVMSYYADSEDYNGTVPVEHIQMLTKGLVDPVTVVGLYKPYNGQRLYNTYVSDQSMYDMLLLAYPSTTELGAWEMNGQRVAELHNELLSFMPDQPIYDEDSEEISYLPAEDLIDVNLLSGQSPRSFE